MNDTDHRTITAWVTQQAMTIGIQKVEGTVDPDSNELVFFTCDGHKRYASDWHLTREAAIAEAERMRDEAIVYHLQQVTELRAMRFEEGE